VIALFGLGTVELVPLGILLLILIGIGNFVLTLGNRAARFGYGSTLQYLRAAPRSDAEKRDAADLTLRGVVFCILGMMFSPIVLVGLVPLFYGGRKLVYAMLGLGLIDDADDARA